MEESAAAIGCDPALVALPLLAALAAAIGNSRRLTLKGDWTEPALLWCVTVVESGTRKSPALDAALRFARERQATAFAEHAVEVQKYKAAQAAGGDKAEPDPPKRCLVADVTVEALALRLQESPRGLLLERDELSG
jgi:hypothetical protein